MTLPPSGAQGSPGWFADPSDSTGSGQLRWWDGAKWTEHTHAADTIYGSAPGAAVGQGTKVYGPFIWLITLLPILSILSLASFDFGGYMRRSLTSSLSGASSLSTTFDPGYLLLQGLGFLIYAVTVLLAFLDWRQLRTLGYPRRFHWAWSFLGGVVYIIGRSVVVRKQVGRGLAPIWVYIGITVVSLIVAGIKISSAMAAIDFSSYVNSSR